MSDPITVFEIEPIQIPDNAMPDIAVVVINYILPDGSNGYTVRTVGDGYITQLAGLLEIAKVEVMRSIIQRET